VCLLAFFSIPLYFVPSQAFRFFYSARGVDACSCQRMRGRTVWKPTPGWDDKRAIKPPVAARRDDKAVIDEIITAIEILTEEWIESNE